MDNILDELKLFRKQLQEYYYYRRQVIKKEEKITEQQLTKANKLHDELAIKAGEYGNLMVDLTGIEPVISTSSGPNNIWTWALSYSANKLVVDALDQVLQVVSLTLGNMQRDINLGIRDQQGNIIGQPCGISVEPLKAFIAHEGETNALVKLKEFLYALGVKYSIAEEEPSDGRQIEGQVTTTYGQADFVVILATKGKAINRKTHAHYMGLNVADELGRAREAKKRVILLLQMRVEPHTNISGIVYERFSPQSMDKAFIKINKELRNWGFIRTGKIEEQKS